MYAERLDFLLCIRYDLTVIMKLIIYKLNFIVIYVYKCINITNQMKITNFNNFMPKF